MSRFYFLNGDINWRDYGAKWYAREVSTYSKEVTYTVVELINWEDAQGEPVTLTGDTRRDYPMAYCGDLHDHAPGKYNYAIEVTRFSTSWYDQDRIDSAIESGCGWGAVDDLPRHKRAIAIMEQCVEYGLGDTVDILYTNNAYKSLRQVKRAQRP